MAAPVPTTPFGGIAGVSPIAMARSSAPRGPVRRMGGGLASLWRSFSGLGLMIGALSPLGVLVGVVVANAVSQRLLEVAFALLLLVVAAQMVRRGLSRAPARPSPTHRAR